MQNKDFLKELWVDLVSFDQYRFYDNFKNATGIEIIEVDQVIDRIKNKYNVDLSNNDSKIIINALIKEKNPFDVIIEKENNSLKIWSYDDFRIEFEYKILPHHQSIMSQEQLELYQSVNSFKNNDQDEISYNKMIETLMKKYIKKSSILFNRTDEIKFQKSFSHYIDAKNDFVVKFLLKPKQNSLKDDDLLLIFDDKKIKTIKELKDININEWLTKTWKYIDLFDTHVANQQGYLLFKSMIKDKYA